MRGSFSPSLSFDCRWHWFAFFPLFLPEHKSSIYETSNLFHFKVNTKRERRSSNHKNSNNHNIAKQPQTDSFETISALVTGLTSTQATMSDDSKQAETLISKSVAVDVNEQSKGTVHENGNHSPSKSLKVKIGNDKTDDVPSSSNGHHPTTTNDHIYETPSNVDSYPSSSFETPTISSSDEQGHNHDQSVNSSSIYSQNGHYAKNGLDSGMASEVTNASNSGTETERTSFDGEASASSAVTSTILSAARLLETNVEEVNAPKRSSSPSSGVVIPEEKRVTDRVKVFEAAANNDQSNMKKQAPRNGNPKKSPTSASFSSADAKPSGKREQVSPVSATDSFEAPSTSESKSSTSKNKTKRPSLKKQIQNLLKIDKSVAQEESTIIEEQGVMNNNGKKANTLSTTTRQKKDSGNCSLSSLAWSLSISI